MRSIGVEPLGNELNADYLAAKFKDKAAPLKAALLDHRHCRAAGQHLWLRFCTAPSFSPRKAGTLARGRQPIFAETLVRHIRAVLIEAIAAVGGLTLQDFAHTDGGGRFQTALRRSMIARARLCTRCGAVIKRRYNRGA